MATVVAFVAKVLATKLFASVTIGTIVKAVASYAISRMLTKKSSGVSSGTTLTMTQQADAYRRVIYGTCRVSGNIFFVHATGKKNKYLHLVIALAGHEVDAIGTTYVEDVAAGLDSGGNGTGDFSGKLVVRKWLGDQTTADSVLVSETSGKWSTDCIAKGIAATYCKLTYDTDVYATGLPTLTWIVNGRKVYDPRTETTAFSRNPALCILDYLRNSDFGLAATDDEIDFASFIAAANICDETVSLAAGGTEPRYRMDAVLTTDSEPASVIETMLSTMGGSLVYSGGKFRLQAGAYYPATEPAIDEGDLRGAIEYQTAAPLSEMCNTVKGTYTSVAALYQQKDYPTVADDSLITSDGGEISRDYSLPWVQSAAQAQRLAKAELRQSRLGGILTLRTNLVGLRYRAGDTILVDNTRYGWSGKVFRIIEWKFAVDSDGSMGVDMTCKEHASGIWDWVAASDEQNSSGGNEDVDIPISTDLEYEPGTYDDLNGSTETGAPLGEVAVEASGGTWSLCGHAEITQPGTYRYASDAYEWHGPPIVASVPPRRYRRWAGSGTVTETLYYPGCTELYPAPATPTTATGAHVISSTTCTDIQNNAAGLYQGVDRREDYTRTSLAITVETGACQPVNAGYHAIITGSQLWQLTEEDTEADAWVRLLDTSPAWSDTPNTAIRTVPATGTTGVRRKIRYRTEHTETSGTQVWRPGYFADGEFVAGHYETVTTTATYPTLIGLTPWQRYRLKLTLERREVTETGTDYSGWVAAGSVYSPGFIADLDGEGGVDWQEIEPEAGYETRIASTAVEEY